MGRKRFGEMHCGIAQALELIGDWWTLLIVRDAFLGARRFGDFEANLGIAKNILSDRLHRLVEHGILQKHPIGDSDQRFDYRLTEKGEALLPVLTSLREWSDQWVFGEGREPVVIKDRRTRQPVPRLTLKDAQGRELTRRDLYTEPGPGATPEIRRRLERPREAEG